MSSAICFNLDQSKILSSGNGLNQIFKDMIHQLLCSKTVTIRLCIYFDPYSGERGLNVSQ